jgi:hypothetical protein
MLEMKAIARNAQYATAQFFKAHDALAVLPAPYAAATTRHVSNEIYHSGGTKRARPLWLLAMDGGQVLCKSALPGVRAIACFSGESIGLLRSSSRAAVLKGHCKIQPRREILGVDVQGDFKGAACTFRVTGSKAISERGERRYVIARGPPMLKRDAISPDAISPPFGFAFAGRSFRPDFSLGALRA